MKDPGMNEDILEIKYNTYNNTRENLFELADEERSKIVEEEGIMIP